jgi:adenylate cyclase
VDPSGDGGGGLTATGLFCGSCGAQSSSTARFCSECGARLTQATQSAEYKQVTVLFADVVHSMDIAAAVGTERLREIMTELVNCASSLVQRYGGTVDKFTGDGIMAVFGAPVALEDHAVRACLAALGIQEQTKVVADAVRQRDGIDLQLRVGLNSGQVIAGEIGSGALGYTAVGEHVGMAQRMESAAPPGGVMLSAPTARLVDDLAALDEPELVQIKGADEPVLARRLLGMAEQHRGAKRVESNLVGRRWEMSAVEGLLDRAIDGRGAVVGVAGPAGIGKSRLVREVAALAHRRGVQVFTTFCESHTSQVPFHVVTRLLRAATGVEGLEPTAARGLIEAQAFLDAELDDVLLYEDLLGIGDPQSTLPRIDPDARRRRLTALVNSATLANKTPAVYVIEDAHWIDEVSESMLADFLTVIPQTPLLTLITYRPEYHGALAQVPGAQTLALAPLSNPETSALVAELLGPDPSVIELGHTIAERAGGTPFFAEEIVRELAEQGVLQGNPGAYLSTAEAAEVSVPATLQATIAARIDRLDRKAKRTLTAAAVVGSRFGVSLLTALGVEPEVADLLGAQLIDQVTFGRQPEYAFHHPLIRAVAYEAQLKSDRADLHRRVAAAIEQSAGSLDENAALIAEHLEAAGDLHAAFDWHMRAGAWSNNRDLSAARVSWERARQVADALPDELADRTAMRITPRTLLCATDWRVHADRFGVRFEELRELCTLAGDKTSLAMGMIGPMGWHAQCGQVREAQRLASESMTLLEAIGDPSLTAQAAFGAIGIKVLAGEMDTALRWAQATIEWANGDPAKGNLIVGSPLAVALGIRGLARSWFGLTGWRADLDNAVAFAEESGEPFTLAMLLSWKYGLGIWNGVLAADDGAIHTTESALRTVEASGDNYAVVMVKNLLSCALLLRGAEGDRNRGLELLALTRDMAVERQYLGSELPVIDVYFGRDQARGGDADGGIPVLRKSVHDMVTRGQVGYYIPAVGVLVETLLDRGADGDVAEAEAAMARLAAAPADGSVIRDVWLLRLRALLARAEGDEAGYRDLRDRYRDMARALSFEGHVAWADAMP